MPEYQTVSSEIAEAETLRNLKEREEVVYIPYHVDSFGGDHLPFWKERMEGSKTTRTFNY